MTDVKRQRAIERTTELQMIKDIRKWFPQEKEEFTSLLEWLCLDSARRRREGQGAQLKKKRVRVRPTRLAGIH